MTPALWAIDGSVAFLSVAVPAWLIWWYRRSERRLAEELAAERRAYVSAALDAAFRGQPTVKRSATRSTEAP